MAAALSLSLLEALSSVPDPRSPRGRRHPLVGVLALLSVATMCGCRSVYAALQWGREQGREMAGKLVPAGANKEEGGEITAAPALLESLVLQGKVVTGDAIHAQRELCRLIVKKGGDYLLTVKENQPKLHNELVDLFRSPCVPLFASRKQTSTGRGPRSGRFGPAANWPAGASGPG